jgi:hypothetical protein
MANPKPRAHERIADCRSSPPAVDALYPVPRMVWVRLAEGDRFTADHHQPHTRIPNFMSSSPSIILITMGLWRSRHARFRLKERLPKQVHSAISSSEVSRRACFLHVTFLVGGAGFLPATAVVSDIRRQPSGEFCQSGGSSRPALEDCDPGTT